MNKEDVVNTHTHTQWNKEDMVNIYTHTQHNTTIKKKEITQFAATLMDLETTILSEVSKYHMISLICRI